MTEDRYRVTRDTEHSRYVLWDEQHDSGQAQHIGEVRYVETVSRTDEPERVLFHTEISPDYSGQGLAGVLVQATVSDTIDAKYRVVPVCPYITSWLQKRSEYEPHVAKVRLDHLQAIEASSKN